MILLDANLNKEHSSLVHEVIENSTVKLTMLDLPLPVPGFEHQITSWVLQDRERGRTLLVDPGPAAVIPTLEKILKEMKVDHLDHVLLTHVHLDHAGGIGHLMKIFPETKIVVPYRGRKHLIDPSRLWKGSVSTLGDMAFSFGELLEVTEDNFHPEDIEIEGLEIIDTPGHASHHQSFIYDSGNERIFFPGEASGVILGREMLDRWTRELDSSVQIKPPVPDLEDVMYMYPASPPVFDLDIAMRSLSDLMEYESTLICYSHYGYSRYPARAMSLHMEQLKMWRDVIRGMIMSFPDPESEELVDSSLRVLLASDGFLSCFEFFDRDVREKELFFLRSSIRGFAGSLS